MYSFRGLAFPVSGIHSYHWDISLCTSVPSRSERNTSLHLLGQWTKSCHYWRKLAQLCKEPHNKSLRASYICNCFRNASRYNTCVILGFVRSQIRISGEVEVVWLSLATPHLLILQLVLSTKHSYYQNDEVKENETDRSFSSQGRRGMHMWCWWEILKELRPLAT
jgi:hypothetical protein